MPWIPLKPRCAPAPLNRIALPLTHSPLSLPSQYLPYTYVCTLELVFSLLSFSSLSLSVPPLFLCLFRLGFNGEEQSKGRWTRYQVQDRKDRKTVGSVESERGRSMWVRFLLS